MIGEDLNDVGQTLIQLQAMHTSRALARPAKHEKKK